MGHVTKAQKPSLKESKREPGVFLQLASYVGIKAPESEVSNLAALHVVLDFCFDLAAHSLQNIVSISF